MSRPVEEILDISCLYLRYLKLWNNYVSVSKLKRKNFNIITTKQSWIIAGGEKMVGKRKDPYLRFRFLVEIDGLIVGGFSEVSGLQVETEVEEVVEGGVNEFVHKLPKRTKYENLVLKRGITDSDVLWKWHQDVVNGKIKRRSGYIILLDGEGNEKWRWRFVDAYPVKWAGPELKADSSAVAIEIIELVHNGIKKA